MVRARVVGLRDIKGKTGQPKTSGGYTFVEVMIVLAVSALMFVAAMVAVGGQQNETGFTLAMQDLNSKIQNYVSQVKTSNGFDLNNYSCQADSSGYPYLTASSDGGGGGCLYLGIAIQTVPGSSTIYAYNTIGNSTIYKNGSDTGAMAGTVDQANPAPAMDKNQNLIGMDTFKLTSGATVKLATADGKGNNPYDILGVYNALPNDSISAGTGGGGIVLKAYQFSSSASNPQSGVISCIEQSGASPCAVDEDTNLEWDICLDSNNGGHTAEIILTGTPNGVTSQLVFDQCKT